MLIYLKLFARRISKDFRQKELLPLKLLFFIHASTLFVLYPYLTIHMRELGINIEETAIMSAVIPVVAIIMPPVAGMIADKIGNFKLLLALFSTLGGLAALLLLLVPIGRITLTYPDQVILGLSCNPKRLDSHLSMSVYQEHICNPAHHLNYNTEITLQSCGFVCQAFTNENDSHAILQAPSYEVDLHEPKTTQTHSFKYEIPKNSINKDPIIDQLSNHRILKNNEHYHTAIRKLSHHSYFFPTSDLFNFTCTLKESDKDLVEYNVTGSENGTMFDVDGQFNMYVCRFTNQSGMMNTTFYKKYAFTIDLSQNSTEDIFENRSIFNVEAIGVDLKDKKKLFPGMCEAGYGQKDKHVSVNVPLYDAESNTKYKTLNLGSCAPRCIATTPRSSMCSNKNSLIEIDMTVTFWSYLAVRVFIAMIGGTAFAMFEGAVIAVLRDKNADYGLQRIYASIGGMISSPVSGMMIDYFSRDKGYTDFRSAFYLYAFLKVVSGVLMLGINLDFKPPAMNVISDVLSVLKKIELIALFISCFILGTAWGYIESFLFWLIQDLGGTRSLMGFTITVGGIAGIPLLVLSGPIIKKIGHANVIFIGFIFYGIRLMGYSLIYNPWHCLFFEAMESVTSSLSFTAAVTYAAKLSSLTTDTSIQGMLGGLYYGVGKGAGSLIGGYLMEKVGTRPTYQIFALMTVITGIIYFCFNHFYIRKYVQTKEEEKKEKPVDESKEVDETNDIPKAPIDLPPGFVDVELMQDWHSQTKPEDTIENGVEKKEKEKPANGYANMAFDKNENNKDETKNKPETESVNEKVVNNVNETEKTNTDEKSNEETKEKDKTIIENN